MLTKKANSHDHMWFQFSARTKRNKNYKNFPEKLTIYLSYCCNQCDLESHIAIQEEVNGTSVTWMEKLNENQYSR